MKKFYQEVLPLDRDEINYAVLDESNKIMEM